MFSFLSVRLLVTLHKNGWTDFHAIFRIDCTGHKKQSRTFLGDGWVGGRSVSASRITKKIYERMFMIGRTLHKEQLVTLTGGVKQFRAWLISFTPPRLDAMKVYTLRVLLVLYAFCRAFVVQLPQTPRYFSSIFEMLTEMLFLCIVCTIWYLIIMYVKWKEGHITGIQSESGFLHWKTASRNGHLHFGDDVITDDSMYIDYENISGTSIISFFSSILALVSTSIDCLLICHMIYGRMGCSR